MRKIKDFVNEWLHMRKIKKYCKSINHECRNCKYCVNNHDWWGCPYNL